MLKTFFSSVLILTFLLAGCDKGNKSVFVAPANLAPVITSTPPTTAMEGELYTYQVTVDTFDGDPTVFTLNIAPTGMVISDTGLITWTPTSADVGDNTVEVFVSDGANLPVVQTFVVTVTAIPVTVTVGFSTPSPATVTAGGAAFVVTASGSPAGGIFGVSNPVSGGTGGIFSTIDPNFGNFTFSGYSVAGTASIDVTYTPTAGSPVTLTYTIIVEASLFTPLLVTDSPCLAIPDDATSSLDATLVVSGGPTSISDLNVLLDIAHDFPADLDITLTSPAGTSIDLTSDNGGGTSNLYSPVILDDAATDSVTTISTAGGTFAPEVALSSFNGENANGTWTLNIFDDFVADAGTLQAWSLAFDGVTLTIPTPSCGGGGPVPLFVSDTPGVGVDDAVSPVTDTLMVTGGPTAIADLDVFVNIPHTFTGDLEVSVTSPAGTTVLLADNRGSTGDDIYSTVVFDDEAGTSITTITSGTAPGGTFMPEAALSAVDGEDANGTWTLTVNDTALGDEGCLVAWGLNFDGGTIVDPGGAGCVPPPVSLLACDTPQIATPDSGMASDTISVVAGPTITDLDVFVNLTHTFSGDLELSVTSPTGTTVLLADNRGGSADDLYAGTTFDDEAGTSITTIAAPGSFIPEAALSAVDGEDSSGTWTLNINDTAAGDDGCLVAWCINVNNATFVDPGGTGCPTLAPTLACSTPQLFVDNVTPAMDTVTVAGGPTMISDVDVFVNIPHTFTGDLEVSVSSPTGTTVLLADNRGGSADDLLAGTTFDDEAGAAISTITAAGSFMPEMPLSAFDGEDSNGSWMINVTDTAGGDEGCLVAWCVNLDGATFVDPGGTPCPTVEPPLLVSATPQMATPDSGAVSDTITVAGGPLIQDLDVFVNLTHTFSGDLELSVTSPAGTNVLLADNRGGSADDLYAGTTFDDEAGASITTIAAPGSFIPEAALSAVDGEDTNGVWTLNINDTAPGDAGCLVAWALNFNGATFVDPGGTPCATMEPPLLVSDTPQVSIPESGPISDTITVAGGPTIEDLDVFVNITHTFTGDLEVSLTSPSATTVVLSDNRGSSGDDIFAGTTFDDEAGTNVTTITSGTAPGGTFIPEQALSGFDGESSNGTWTLNINDTATPDSGCLVAWALNFNGATFVDPGGTPCPPPVTGDTFTSGPVNIDFGSAAGSGFPDTITSNLVVTGVPTITEVAVQVQVTHNFIADVQLSVTSPSSTTVMLSQNNGDIGANMGVIFDDDAGVSIATFAGNTPPPFVMFSPIGMLSDFDGEDPNGTWFISVTDTSPAVDNGVLNNWGLALNGADF